MQQVPRQVFPTTDRACILLDVNVASLAHEDHDVPGSFWQFIGSGERGKVMPLGSRDPALGSSAHGRIPAISLVAITFCANRFGGMSSEE